MAAGLCLVNVVFAWKWLPESRAGQRRDERQRPEADLASRLAGRCGTRRDLVSRLIWIYGIGMIAFSAMTSVLSLYLQAAFGLTEKTIGPDLRLRRACCRW